MSFTNLICLVSFEDQGASIKSKKNKKGDDSEDSDEDDELDNELKSKFTDEMDWEEQGVEVSTNQRASKRDAEKTILGEDLKPKAKKQRLTPEELAMGEQLIYSSKSARELEEWGWNKYANNDEGLPDWFVDDEKKHYFKTAPVTKVFLLIENWKITISGTSQVLPWSNERAECSSVQEGGRG